MVDLDFSDTSRNNFDDECMFGLVDMEFLEDSDDFDNNESEVRIWYSWIVFWLKGNLSICDFKYL